MHLGAHLQEIYENIHLHIMAQDTSRYMFKKICFMFCILMKNMFNLFQYERYMFGFCYLQKIKWNCIRKYFSLFLFLLDITGARFARAIKLFITLCAINITINPCNITINLSIHTTVKICDDSCS